MKFNAKKVIRTIVSLCAPLLGACMLPGSSIMIPSSEFVYPNSNVYPLEMVHGSAHRLCGILIFPFGSPGGEDIARAQKDAMRASKGDILINIQADTSLFMLPYIFSVCNASIRGTAAKMEVGRQDISAHPVPPVEAPSSSAFPPPPPAQPVSAPAQARGGCVRDSECKGQRVCRAGACVHP